MGALVVEDSLTEGHTLGVVSCRENKREGGDKALVSVDTWEISWEFMIVNSSITGYMLTASPK